MRYIIYHIDGSENRLADLGSRRGNRFAQKKQAESVAKGLAGGPRPLMMAPLNPSKGDKKAFWTKHPATSDEVQKPDQNIAEFLVMPENNDLVDRVPIATSQAAVAAKKPAGLTQDQEDPPLWKNSQAQVWIPEADKELCKKSYTVAGHRRKEATLQILQRHVFWKDMAEDVANWRASCLQCLKAATGEMIERPLGSQLVAEKSGEILMMAGLHQNRDEPFRLRICTHACRPFLPFGAFRAGA